VCRRVQGMFATDQEAGADYRTIYRPLSKAPPGGLPIMDGRLD
jgi:hypothetical protein